MTNRCGGQCLKKSGPAGRISLAGLTLPAEVSGLAGRPLYLIVAHWGLRLRRDFTPQEVQATFTLTAQQTSDVLSYIYNSARSRIVSERVMTRSPFGREVVQRWRILSVDNAAPPVSGRRRRAGTSGVSPQDAALLSALRRQLSAQDDEG